MNVWGNFTILASISVVRGIAKDGTLEDDPIVERRMPLGAVTEQVHYRKYRPRRR